MMLSLLFILYFILSFIFGDMGLISHSRMKKNYQRIEQELESLSNENEKFRKEVEALKTDPHYIEKLARERLDLSKDGEIIYQYEKDKKDTKEQGDR